MSVERTIRVMTPEEKHAKRQWGTGACQARSCTARASYLAVEADSQHGDWWQYCCPKHARSFAEMHGLELPALPPKASRMPEPAVEPA